MKLTICKPFNTIDSHSIRTGFTLVELLVVITIIGIIMALLLPAVNAARESARQLQCQNNLKQIATACQTHLTRNDGLPSGGAYNYMGVRDWEFKNKQVGGWIYNILPYIEQGALHDMCTTDALRGRAAATPIKILYCPTRRSAQAYPMSQKPKYFSTSLTMFGKTDYAANGGNSPDIFEGATAASEKSTTYLSGVVRPMNNVSDKEIRDGSSHTILAGEKYIAPEQYETGTSKGDDSVALVGWDIESVRFAPFFNGQTGKPEKYDNWKTLNPVCDETNTTNKLRKPMMDTRGEGTSTNTYNFGSAHTAFFQAVMVDASVRKIKYAINPKIFGCLCNRADDVALSPKDIN